MNYKRVSKKIIAIKEIVIFIVWFCLSIFPFIFIEAFSLWWNIILIPLFIAYFLLAFIYIPISYKFIQYGVNDKKIVYSHGVFIQSKQIMYTDKIVFVTLVRSPFTPIFKTAAVAVKAAGAAIYIPFLDLEDAKNLVKKLSNLNEV